MSIKVKIKLDEMIDAMENHNNYISHYINLETGEIIFTADDYFIEDIENDNNLLINENPENFCFIEPIESDNAFRIMENFIKFIPEREVQEIFYKAIYRPKPFRHFKIVLMEHPEFKQQYTDYHREQMTIIIEEWLDEKNILAELI